MYIPDINDGCLLEKIKIWYFLPGEYNFVNLPVKRIKLIHHPNIHKEKIILMKAWIPLKAECKILFILLFSIILNTGSGYKSHAQGWSFTPSIVQTDCGNSSYTSTANAMLATFSTSVKLPTQPQCEAIRQMLNGFSTGGDWYSSGNPPVLHHCSLTIKCTPCEGSDINTPGQVNPGDVSFDGQTDGRPLFTPHQSEAFEDWARDYKALLESYGITSILGNRLYPHPIPLTGDKNTDKLYDSLAAKFNPPAPVDSGVYVGGSRVANGLDDFLNKKPVLFRSDQENKDEQERDWLRAHPGLGPFAPVPGDGIPYLEEGDFWSNFVTDKELVKMEQHALFAGIALAAGLSGVGAVAEAGVGIADVITYSVPIVEVSVNSLQECMSGNCPSTETMIQNMLIGEAPNVVGAAGEAISGAIGAAALNGVNAINTSEIGKSTFKAVFGTLDQARDGWETLTKKGQ